MPASRQALYISPDIASSASPPNDMVPKQSSETDRPVRPRSFVFMGRVLARGLRTWVERDEANEKPRQGYLAGCESIPVWGILFTRNMSKFNLLWQNPKPVQEDMQGLRIGIQGRPGSPCFSRYFRTDTAVISCGISVIKVLDAGAEG